MNNFFYSKKVGRGDNVMTLTDHFDIDRVIRSYALNENELIVLLDDGHEDSQYVDVPKANSKGVEIKKERRWVQSEIVLTGGDIPYFWKALGMELDLAHKVYNEQVEKANSFKGTTSSLTEKAPI